MSSPSVVLAEPLTLGQGSISRHAWCNRKVLVVFCLFVGLVFVFFGPMRFPRSGDRKHLTFEEPAVTMIGSPISSSCPRSGAPMTVDAMQDALKKYGFPSSPLTRFALAKYAATRDVSMAAQVEEEFSRLDPVNQAKLKKLNREVVARAEYLKKEDLVGATAPLGFWDPFGLAKQWENKRGGPAMVRVAELKHGRVCMLATLGIIVSEKFHPVLDAWGEPYVSAVQSHFTPTLQAKFWPLFIVLCGSVELLGYKSPDYWLNSTIPGDYGFDPLNLRPTKAGELNELQNKELNNGRLAMIAAAGIIAQELVTGKNIF